MTSNHGWQKKTVFMYSSVGLKKGTSYHFYFLNWYQTCTHQPLYYGIPVKLLIRTNCHTMYPQSLQRMVRNRENIQWAAGLWAKIPCRCQRSEQNSQTGSSQEKSNHLLLSWYAEEYLWTHNKKNFEADGLQHQDHTGCHTWHLLKTGNWGYSLYRLTKMG